MSAFIQQLPALVGVVIGSLGSYAAVTLGDRARFRREREVRWEDRRLAAYAEYGRAQKTIVTLLYRTAAFLDLDPHPHPLRPEDSAPLLTTAAEARDLAWEALLLLGDAEVAAAAHDWAGVVTTMESTLHTGPTTPPTWQALLTDQRTARDRYYAAARTDITLPPNPAGHLRLDQGHRG
ncbi:hypothetical protein NX794_04555 [Streptomyces sp. LP11]|uniref:Secreted protein n=1 Tax=Streptomyces pyxinicus TaxID=2970331 RepID=A0ABT2AW76_9ACTN|nr:hypothetical protein [Streptomyces sp. LP11]MCS0600505.1 hypothetical protein [Streptomyces sp. LP11]